MIFFLNVLGKKRLWKCLVVYKLMLILIGFWYYLILFFLLIMKYCLWYFLKILWIKILCENFIYIIILFNLCLFIDKMFFWYFFFFVFKNYIYFCLELENCCLKLDCEWMWRKEVRIRFFFKFLFSFVKKG